MEEVGLPVLAVEGLEETKTSIRKNRHQSRRANPAAGTPATN